MYHKVFHKMDHMTVGQVTDNVEDLLDEVENIELKLKKAEI